MADVCALSISRYVMFACLSASIELLLRYDINLYLLVRIIELKNDVVYKVWNIMIPCIDIEIKLKNRGSI